MNRLIICLLLLATLSACAGAGTSTAEEPTFSYGEPSSSGPAFRCNEWEKICIHLSVEEPIQMGEPINLIVTVTSEKDISDLNITLTSVDSPKALFEEPNLQSWRERDVTWTVNSTTDGPLTSIHKLLLPAEEGYYQILVTAGVIGKGQLVADEISIYLTKEGGKVYFANTPIPITGYPPDNVHRYSRSSPNADHHTYSGNCCSKLSMKSRPKIAILTSTCLSMQEVISEARVRLPGVKGIRARLYYDAGAASKR